MRTIEELKAEVAATLLPQETKGEARGRAERNLEIARSMKNKGLDSALIAECTGLSIVEVDEL